MTSIILIAVHFACVPNRTVILEGKSLLYYIQDCLASILFKCLVRCSEDMKGSNGNVILTILKCPTLNHGLQLREFGHLKHKPLS